MTEHITLIDTLVRCKNNVQDRIRPLLKTVRQPQPNLGVGAGGDPMKRIDLAAESAIVNTLRRNNLSFTLISEESGVKEYGETPDECYVTVDPIDGTTNLMKGIPFYATSIAISKEPVLGSVHAALVTDLTRKITYTAQKGKGACRNNRKIAPSKTASLKEAVIGIDLNTYKIPEIAPRLTSLIKKTEHIRHFGANALELCYVADGAADAFIDIRGKLRTTDMAAAWLIIKEAGALITTPEGKPLNAKLHPTQKVAFVASANQRMHANVLDLIKH